ncbi:MAG: hypothetical protein J6V88_05100 [Kiritimatiellae bacterium]|nr:hypothetical protein [Kiritimatiellia bacterium]
MSEELQNLLDKIQRDGIDKANADAEKIIADAKAQANEIVKKAKADADQEIARSDAEQKAFALRASETIRQAARDVVLEVEGAVTTLLTKLLTENVNAALSDPDTVKKLAAETITAFSSNEDVTIATGEKFVEAIRAELVAKQNIKIITDELAETGFSVRLDGGRVEHEFTGEAIAAALSKRLRPQLASLIK